MIKFIKAAGASFALLLVLAPCVVEARRRDDCGGPRATPDAGRRPRVRLK